MSWCRAEISNILMISKFRNKHFAVELVLFERVAKRWFWTIEIDLVFEKLSIKYLILYIIVFIQIPLK
jgi:hypothetical protein